MGFIAQWMLLDFQDVFVIFWPHHDISWAGAIENQLDPQEVLSWLSDRLKSEAGGHVDGFALEKEKQVFWYYLPMKQTQQQRN